MSFITSLGTLRRLY